MSPVKVIERLLVRECATRESSKGYEACIVCPSRVVWRIVSLFPEGYVVSNGAAQVFPNLATIYYSVKELRVPLVAIVGSTSLPLENFLKMTIQSAEFEFKLLKKTYEENGELLLTLYEDKKKFNAALLELNIDQQIEKLFSLSEINNLVSKGELAVCGFILDEDLIYGDRQGFYLINFNGLRDPDEIRSSELLNQLPPSLKKQKIKRVHVQI
ncbi:hypothetical protein [Thermovibrio sp.]